jgi:fructose-bisphosphate aldolase class I
MNEEMLNKMGSASGFIAALDQSGGSTPKALALYGIGEDQYGSDQEMFDHIHAMRSRICMSPAFGGDRVLGAILFEMTMDRDIGGIAAPSYLWDVKGVVPFLKCDKGLADEADDAQILKPIPDLSELLTRAVAKGVFGTKMRSVIKADNPVGVAAVVDQQFAIGREILDHGLMPIIEPEVDIHSPTKAAAEVLLKAAIVDNLASLPDGAQIMLKLSLPSVDGFYRELIDHPKVLRVVALSGGYSRAESNEILSRQHGMIASFSRALTEGLSAQQSDAEFDATLDATIASIAAASAT